MDSAELQQLVVAGESEHLVFKKTTGELKAGMTTLCALLNGAGGRVVFGVTPSGKIAGQQVTDSTLQDVPTENGYRSPTPLTRRQTASAMAFWSWVSAPDRSVVFAGSRLWTASQRGSPRARGPLRVGRGRSQRAAEIRQAHRR